MQLKEIEPGMVIHCKNDMEYEQLNKEVISLGFGSLPCAERVNEGVIDNIVFFLGFDGAGWEYVGDFNGAFIEFSDLIIPELSAEEVFEIMAEMHKECYGKIDGCLGCPIRTVAEHCDADCYGRNAKAIIAVCEQWKADHEKKKPEVEWVDVCRIIEANSSVRHCVYEEVMHKDDESRHGWQKNAAAEILKKYISEHEGNYIAVVERVCRVKQ